MQPDKSLPWWGQVLDLEARGKPTTPAAHDLAIEAKAHSEGRRSGKMAMPAQGEREPGSDDDWVDE